MPLALEQSLGGKVPDLLGVSLFLQGKPRSSTTFLDWTFGPSALLPHTVSSIQQVQPRQAPKETCILLKD